MRRGHRRSRRLGRTVNLAGAALISAVLLWVMAAGFGTVPPLGAVLDAGRGAWTSAAGGRPVTSQTLRLPGLQHPVSVTYTTQGIASVRASTDHDAFLALGYVHASFRLAEMDEERRLGEGRLAQLAGPSDLPSDEFELRLGLVRTAQREWAHTPRSSPAGQALLAYAQGVNARLTRVRADGDWPAAFSLARVYPGPWTPVDSLVVQGVLTEELDFTATPLDDALLEKSLGAARTMAWFPVIPANQQSPYDPGPYQHPGLTPLAPDAASTAPGPPATVRAGRSAGTAGRGNAPSAARSGSSSAVTTAAGTLLAQLSRLPAGLVHREPDSNAWAANGPAVAGGGALLAGDPHLLQTLPSVWYEAALSAPGLDASGVTVPGVPGVLIGHNARIAWSLTDTQNQAALFYAERTSASRPDQYYWRGAWRRTQRVRYTISVRGGAPVHLTVYLTVHGPIMTQAGQTMAVDWMGNVPSADLAALLGVDEAGNFGQFKAALAGWHAPAQNFVYADDQGNIGAISAGYYPQVAHGDPWLPLPGTGADDVDGVIPYAAEPQAYDPPGHVVATANQRPVGPSYPYYIGTSADFFDNSFRANEIYGYLRGHSAMTPASFADLQGNVTDSLAATIVPRLLTALRQAPGSLSVPERTAMSLLAGWNDTMTTGSAAGFGLVDVLGRLHLRGVPAVVDVGARPGREGPRGPGAVLVADQPDRGPGRLDRRPGGAVGRVRPPVGCAPHRRPGDAGGVRGRRRAPGREAGRDTGRLDVGAAAHPVLPVGKRGRGPGLRAARVQRRRLDGGRGRRGPAVQHRPELADDRGLLRCRVRVRRRPFAGGRRLPGRPEREPGVPVVRQPDRRLVGQPLSADGVYRERGRGSCPLVPAARPAGRVAAGAPPQRRCGDRPSQRWCGRTGEWPWLICASSASGAVTGWAPGGWTVAVPPGGVGRRVAPPRRPMRPTRGCSARRRPVPGLARGWLSSWPEPSSSRSRRSSGCGSCRSSPGWWPASPPAGKAGGCAGCCRASS